MFKYGSICALKNSLGRLILLCFKHSFIAVMCRLWGKKRFYLFIYLGPVVQSIVSLTSSLRGQFDKCFTTL